MTTMTFDTLKYTKKLEAAGFTRAQTEVIADALRESGGDYSLKSETVQFKSEMKHDFQAVEGLLHKEIQSLENRIQKELAPIRTNLAVIMWTQGLIILTLVVPALKHLLGT